MRHATALDNLANAERMAFSSGSKMTMVLKLVKTFFVSAAVFSTIGAVIITVIYTIKDTPEEILYKKTYSQVYNECTTSKEVKLAAGITLYSKNLELSKFNTNYMVHGICESRAKQEAKKVSGIEVK